jgi:hypothetical protein
MSAPEKAAPPYPIPIKRAIRWLNCIIPDYAAKVPYVYDMAYHVSLPEEAFQQMEQMMKMAE